MTESEIKLVERLWASGKGVGEIARLLPYKEYIAKREIAELKKKGVLKGKSGKSQANTQAIIERLKSGKRVREICIEFGVSTQYVYEVKNKFVKEQQNER